MANKKKKKGGLGRLLFLVVCLAAAGGVALWFLQPEMVQSQIDQLKSLFGK